MTTPLISCLCLTIPGREHFLSRAIDCFNRQTWPDRELIIVADSGVDWLRVTGRSKEVKKHQCSTKLSVGAKRNIGCALAQGTYIAFWDDDDYSAPLRLEVQAQALLLTGKAVTAFAQMPFLMPDGTWYMNDDSTAPGVGTSLFFSHSWWADHPFQERTIGGYGEDGIFREAAKEAGQLVTLPEQHLMYAVRHDRNTWQINLNHGWALLKDFTWTD